MSNEVAVFNDNIYPYKEYFRDRWVEIPSKGHIMMDKDEAQLFLGTMNQPVLDADGNHMAQGFKMLKILNDKAPELQRKSELVCNACGQVFHDQSLLEKHILAMHVEQLEDKEAAKEAIAKKPLPKGAKTARNT